MQAVEGMLHVQEREWGPGSTGGLWAELWLGVPS